MLPDNFILIFVICYIKKFLFVYSLCGITDLADGFIARRFNSTTSTEAKMDSLADIVFSLVILYYIYSLTQLSSNSYMIIYISLVLVLRTANIIITKIKFKQWNVIHTVGNKIAGLVLFSILPFYFIYGLIPIAIIEFLTTLALFSLLEEICILLFSKYYDVNRKGLFIDR